MMEKMMDMGLAVRGFMNKNFPTMVDFMFPVSLVVLFIAIIDLLSNMSEYVGAWIIIKTFVLFSIVGVISIVAIFGLIYVLIDMRETLKKENKQ